MTYGSNSMRCCCCPSATHCKCAPKPMWRSSPYPNPLPGPISGPISPYLGHLRIAPAILLAQIRVAPLGRQSLNRGQGEKMGEDWPLHKMSFTIYTRSATASSDWGSLILYSKKHISFGRSQLYHAHRLKNTQ